MHKKALSKGIFALSFPLAAMMAGGVQADAPEMTAEEMDRAGNIYFQRCAGCHGTLRGGATGPGLLPEDTIGMGQRRLESIITLGTEGGMNNFDGILDPEEITLISKYIQQPPEEPPEMSLADIRETWKIIVPEEEWPDSPQHDLNWENFMVTILRDRGAMGIIDGDTKQLVTEAETGYAVHVAKSSSDGRFWYVQGRDGRLSKIDLWMDPPQVTAEVFIGIDARDVAVSKYGEWENKYVIGGGYWPPHFVIADAHTMEPLKVVSTRGYNTKGEYVHEARVAALYDTPMAPSFLVNVKETGMIWQVDYSDLENLRIDKIESAEFLHDGFFDSTGRYFMIAANFSNRMAFVDTVERKLVSLLDTGAIPHPGPGANWVDPECGPVAGTTHLGEGRMSFWGTDPENYPEHAWQICDIVETDGPGLFLRSHPNSPHVWIDQSMHPEADVNQWIQVMNKETRELTPIHVADRPAEHDAVALHFEYDQSGEEVWVSIWARGRGHQEDGAIVIFDDKTMEEKARVENLYTPTGKFNVYNRKAKYKHG
ncbi:MULTISPECIES: cytochrome D1 domain-containing protein [Halomonas]|jgi:nitrite reductase (NO-forming)/hydroxylamine reductase|uniref:Cytochrome D1 domain-containing protein n=1 Tax=Halomonas mongoliensis TaxID=321265 RepID=A0ABU1GNZ5_9GAMM|nr:MULTISPECIES: cytochrome D1 domain-containing protein [Halomonas]MDR5893750.1 cytochrome D1 domain-containing protein [Halomonas mongoliensis]